MMNLERLKASNAIFLLFFTLILAWQPFGAAAPRQAQSATQAVQQPAAPAAQPAPQPAEQGTLTEIAPNLFALTEADGNGNVAFLVTDEGVIVVDSGETPAAGHAILARIRLKTDKSIRYIILTQRIRNSIFCCAG